MKKFDIKKVILAIAIGFLLSGVAVSAAEVLYSKNFTYSTSNSTLKSTNVQEAIDELAEKSKSYCPSKYKCYKKKSTPEVGDYVKMTPTMTSYTTDTSKTGYTRTQTINPSELNLWRVLKVNSDGTIEMISEYTSSTPIYFEGKVGYQNFVGYLNELASKYQNSKYTIGSRHVGYNGQTEYITDTSKIDSTTAPWTSATKDNLNEKLGGGDILYQNDYNLMQTVLGTNLSYNVKTNESVSYWLASRYYNYFSPNSYYYGRRINNGTLSFYSLLILKNNAFSTFLGNSNIRPIVVLNSKINYSSASGIKDDPFILN